MSTNTAAAAQLHAGNYCTYINFSAGGPKLQFGVMVCISNVDFHLLYTIKQLG